MINTESRIGGLGSLLARNACVRGASPAFCDGRETLSWREAHDVGRSIRSQLGDTARGARLALCGDPGLKTLPMVAALLGAGASVALLDDIELGRTQLALDAWAADGWIDVETSLDPSRIEFEVRALCKQRRPVRAARGAVPSVVFSTSGSTGCPRLVSLPENRVLAGSAAIAHALGLFASDRILSATASNFAYGFNQLILGALSGACVVKGGMLDLGYLLRDDQLPVTVLASGPSQLRTLATMREAKVRSEHLRMITSVGSPFPVEVGDHLLDLWPASQIRPMYGMTECMRVSIATHDQFLSDPTTTGHPLPGVQVAIDSATNEILVETPYLMDFNSSRSETGTRVTPIDGRRVLATGDLGRLSEDGQLWVTGRTSQFAKIVDTRVSLAECEQVANQHPEVREVAATAGPDQIVLWCEPIGDINRDEVTDQLRRAVVAWHGVLAQADIIVEFPPRLPRLPNGKIDRPMLKSSSCRY